jgi:hypothetical protein
MRFPRPAGEKQRRLLVDKQRTSLERVANITAWPSSRIAGRARMSPGIFASILIASGLASAAMASWMPLQISIITVFLFAGPHNWFELRYFIMRLPARFGRSRNFFAVAFGGIFGLTVIYLAMPALYYANFWSGANWPDIIAIWNTLLLLWLGALVVMRAKQNSRRDWFWALPVVFVLCSLNWLAPQLFSLAIVYLHPLIALWFLDRHLRRTRPEWLRIYHRCLCLLPIAIFGMVWYLNRTSSLNDDNGLFWRITQHAGADLLPKVSSHLLVSLHVFLEMLHYAVWIIALPLIGATGPVWQIRTIPLARRRGGFPRLIGGILLFGLFMVALLWLGFSVNYPEMRDVYFALAISHVLAEAPFLLRMI